MRKHLRSLKNLFFESIYTNRINIQVERSIFSFTFDDAPVSAGEVGGRILEDVGATGTFYISSGLAGAGEEDHLLSNEEIIALSNRGHDIQCHTKEHIDLRRTREEDIVANCRLNRQYLEKLLPGKRVNHFAYPFGRVSPWGKRALRSEYKTMRTTELGINAGRIDLAYLRGIPLYSSQLDRQLIEAIIHQCSLVPGWVIFYTHDVAEQPTRYGIHPNDFRWVVSSCLGKGEFLNISEAFSRVSASSRPVGERI